MTIMFWIWSMKQRHMIWLQKIYLHENLSSRFIRCKILKFVLLVAILSSFVPSLSRCLRRGRPHRLITSGNSFIVCKKDHKAWLMKSLGGGSFKQKKIIRNKKSFVFRLPCAKCILEITFLQQHEIFIFWYETNDLFHYCKTNESNKLNHDPWIRY